MPCSRCSRARSAPRSRPTSAGTSSSCARSRPARRCTFEQAREQLAREQAEADRERAFNELTSKLVDLVYKNPTALAPAARRGEAPGAEARSVPAQQAARASPPMPAVQRAAFSDSMIQDGTGQRSDRTRAEPRVLIRVDDARPARDLPLAQVRDRRSSPRCVRDRASKAAAAAPMRWSRSSRAARRSQPLRPNAARALRRARDAARHAGAGRQGAEAFFAVPAPAAGKSSRARCVLADGSIVVFAVTKVTPGDPDEATPEQRAGCSSSSRRWAARTTRVRSSQAMRKRMKWTSPKSGSDQATSLIATRQKKARHRRAFLLHRTRERVITLSMPVMPRML